MRFLRLASVLAFALSSQPAWATLSGTEVTGCFDAIPDADVGSRTTCVGDFQQSPATVRDNDLEFWADTQSGMVFADFDSATIDSHKLFIGLSEPTQGMNPTIWEFTGLDWGGTGVIDSLQLVDDSTFPILRSVINADQTSVFIEAARIEFDPEAPPGPRGFRAQFLVTGRHAPSIPEPGATLVFAVGLAVVASRLRRS
jgi:hypothetical protein